MNTLVTGTFEAAHQAAQAVRKLVKSCVPVDLVRTTPSVPGKRHVVPASDGMRQRRNIKVAIMAPEYVAKQLAIKILRDYGAHDIECASAEPKAKSRARVRVSVRNPHAPVTA